MLSDDLEAPEPSAAWDTRGVRVPTSVGRGLIAAWFISTIPTWVVQAIEERAEDRAIKRMLGRVRRSVFDTLDDFDPSQRVTRKARRARPPIPEPSEIDLARAKRALRRLGYKDPRA